MSETLEQHINRLVDERFKENMNRYTAQGLSVPEAASRLGLSTSTAWRAIRKGEIRSERVLGRVLVPVSEIDRILEHGLG